MIKSILPKNEKIALEFNSYFSVGIGYNSVQLIGYFTPKAINNIEFLEVSENRIVFTSSEILDSKKYTPLINLIIPHFFNTETNFFFLKKIRSVKIINSNNIYTYYVTYDVQILSTLQESRYDPLKKELNLTISYYNAVISEKFKIFRNTKVFNNPTFCGIVQIEDIEELYTYYQQNRTTYKSALKIFYVDNEKAYFYIK